MEAKWSSVFMHSADPTPGLALQDSPPSCVSVLEPVPGGIIPEVKSSISMSRLLARASSLARCFVFHLVSEFQKPKQPDNSRHFATQTSEFLHGFPKCCWFVELGEKVNILLLHCTSTPSQTWSSCRGSRLKSHETEEKRKVGEFLHLPFRDLRCILKWFWMAKKENKLTFSFLSLCEQQKYVTHNFILI